MLQRLYRRVPRMRVRWQWWSDGSANVVDWTCRDDDEPSGWGVEFLWGLLTDSKVTVMSPGVRVIVTTAGHGPRQATIHLPKVKVR